MFRSAAPKSVRLYGYFCIAMLILNLGLTFAVLAIPSQLDLGVLGPIEIGWTKQLLFLTGIVLTISYAVLLVLPINRTAYVLHLTNLAVSAGSCIWVPICAPMILTFRSAEVQNYFGLGPEER
ncbi:MAG: hypothetical protein JNM85_10330 [Chthonomonas sp.]|nr:hypothetical protein [Chthonomonas sp.]